MDSQENRGFCGELSDVVEDHRGSKVVELRSQVDGRNDGLGQGQTRKRFLREGLGGTEERKPE